jgi:F-type H+-transporting ATPase subunit alpha
MALEDEIIVLFAGINGFLDDLPVEKVRPFETGLIAYMHQNLPDLCRTIATGEKMSDETQDALKVAIEDFKATGMF